MKKLLCAVLAIVTLVACLVGFKANEEKPLPVYREVEDIPQKGNLTMKRVVYPRQPYYRIIDGQVKLVVEGNVEDEMWMKEYEEYLYSRNIPTTLPEKELPFTHLPYKVETDMYGLEYTTLITSQEELACYFASVIEEWETHLAEYKATRSLETITGHRAKVVEHDIRIMEYFIKSNRYSYQKMKETIDFETQAFLLVPADGEIQKIAVDGTRLIVLEYHEPGHCAPGYHALLIDKADLPAAGNEIEVVSFTEYPDDVFPYSEDEGFPYYYNGRVRFLSRIFFDPVDE